MYYAAVCWGGSIRHKDTRRRDRLVRKAAVTGARLDSLGKAVERWTLKMAEVILNNSGSYWERDELVLMLNGHCLRITPI